MQPLSYRTKEEFSLRPGIKKALTLLVVFFTVWVCLRLLLPLLSPFLLGTLLALLAEPAVRFLTRQFRLPRAVGAGIGVSIAFCLVTMLLLLLGAFLVRQLSLLAGQIPNLEQTAASGMALAENWLLKLTGYTPGSIRPLLENNVRSFFSDGTALVERVAGYLLGLAGNLLSHVPDSALGLGTGVISAYLISVKLPKIRRFLLRRIPRERLKAALAALRQLKKALGSWLKAQAKLMGVTFVILLLGFVILQIPFAPLWALGVCLVDAFPILGTGAVLLPWSILLFLRNEGPKAIGLLGLYVTVMLTRSILEPKLVGRHLGLDPLATLMILYSGYKLWGIAGMFFAPLLAAMALQLMPDQK